MLSKVDPLEKTKVVNKELKGLYDELRELYVHRDMDGFCLYMYGVVLKEMDSKKQAISVLVESVNMYPWNWSAWKVRRPPRLEVF